MTTSVNGHDAPRHELLLRKVRTIGSADSGVRMHQVLFVAGAVAVPLGLLFLVLGWLGVARTALVFDQLPYLASGCLIGLALVVLGGFLYFAHWQTLLLQDGRKHHRQLVEHQRELVDRLERLESALLTRSAPQHNGRAVTASPSGSGLVATNNGTMVHRPNCPVMRGRDGLREVSHDELGDLRPCRMCNPLGVDSPATT